LVEKAEKTIWSHWPPSKSPRATFCQKEKDTFQATQAALFKRWKGKKCTFIFFHPGEFFIFEIDFRKKGFLCFVSRERVICTRVFFNLLVSEAFPSISPFHQNKLTSRVSFISINCIVCLCMYVYIGIGMISVYFSVSYPSRIQKWNTVQSLFQAFRYFIKKLHQECHLFLSINRIVCLCMYVYRGICRYD
jgi:hypothetical protein